MSNISPGPYAYTYSPSTSDANKATDTTRVGTATSTLTNLTASLGLAPETCAQVSIVNTSANTLFVSSNSGSAMPIASNAGFTFNVWNTNLLRVSGSGTYAAVITV